MRSRRALWKTAAVLAAVFLVVAMAWLWRGPDALVRTEYERQRRTAGLSLRHADVAGHRWAYAERATAPPDAPLLVMIHGFTGSKENWYPLAERLGDRYRLVIPDLPGWGASERKPGEDYGFRAQGERVATFIRYLAEGTDAPVVLLGHSMGGGIAAVTAAGHPGLVDRVGLISAAGVRFDDNAFGEAVLAGENPFEVHDEASLRHYIDTVFHRAEAKPWIPKPAARALVRMRRAQAPFEQAVLDRIGRGDESFLPGEAATRIDQPALLLWCDRDGVIDPSAMDLYGQRIPQAVKVLLDDCGHMSIMERPDEVALAVDRLMETGEPR